ncbi:hypothetical protein NEMIN01_1275 [Nematocida minor]|uniref:uncharacterized protein n=1 Tax=Nematocida minor TaxID=1912983 RepID=UPI00221E7FD5|nr:uncharacterized protein NEMIN01_1275 [Nematocida minor]KAI5190942.1 hypothetical protein NEMIN01_1275 [Nematocida minor]
MDSCLFCKIANKEMGTILCENKEAFVIADINPLSKGHLLVIPKQHAPRLGDVPDTVLQSVATYIKKVAMKLGLDKYNILQNNGHIQSVHHVHFHIIPYNEEDKEGLNISWKVSEKGKASVPECIEEYKKKLQSLNQNNK